DLTATELLAGLPDAGEQAHRRLRDRLAAAADAAGILDVAYRTVDSPVGSLLLAATGEGLVRVAYASEGHDAVLDRLAARVSPRVLSAPARHDAAAREIEEYLAARRTRSDLPHALPLRTGLRPQDLSRRQGLGSVTARPYR